MIMQSGIVSYASTTSMCARGLSLANRYRHIFKSGMIPGSNFMASRSIQSARSYIDGLHINVSNARASEPVLWFATASVAARGMPSFTYSNSPIEIAT